MPHKMIASTAEFRLRMHEAATGVLEDVGVRYINLLAAFAARGGEGLFLPGDPVHMNARGNALVAEALATEIRRSIER